MNAFASTENSGLLKDSYGDSSVSEALERKRKKLAETRLGLKTDEEESKDGG